MAHEQLRMPSMRNPSLPLALPQMTTDVGFLPDDAIHDAQGNIVMRSSDSVEFRANRWILESASPVLKALIAKQRTFNLAADEVELPVIALPERYDVFRCLISMILPVKLLLPTTLEQTLSVLATAQKYEMSSAMALIRQLVPLSGFDYPSLQTLFWGFRRASELRLYREAVAFARMSLVYTRHFTLKNLGAELHHASGECIFNFIACRAKCQQALSRGVQQFRQCRSDASCSAGLQPCLSARSISDPHWLDDFLSRSTADLGDFDEQRFFFAWLEIKRVCDARFREGESKCSFCADRVSTGQVRRIWLALDAHLMNSLESIERDLSSIIEGATNRAQPSRHVPDARAIPQPPDADIVLKSSSGEQFWAHKVFLSLASPVFQGMLMLPPFPSTSEGPPVLPVVELSENSEVLSAVLTWIYPVCSVVPTSFEEDAALLACMQKYEMEGILSVLRRSLSPTPHSHIHINPDNAFRAYVLATQHRLKEEALIAARATLHGSMTWEHMGSDLRLINGVALSELSEYQISGQRAARECVLKALAGSSLSSGTWKRGVDHPDHCPDTKEDSDLPAWWASHVQSVLNNMFLGVDSVPIAMESVVDNETFRMALNAHVEKTGCEGCLAVFAQGGDRFPAMLREEINGALDKVVLALTW
ncbi:hypothetical protein FA95DRAFT_1612597 [Auriscalpium vulgare]|uniref:Uncharacterized protein n=1 Tax=Auriscalpium vulgare TaxID=40419 RepID=A0ACB8R691_9AGAM|nr:hypothetical protein FA95DRAFT_1612597 [Auriscalpium vulgare]